MSARRALADGMLATHKRDGDPVDVCMATLRAAGFAVVPLEPTEAAINRAYQTIFPNHGNPDAQVWHRVREAMIAAAQEGRE